MLEKTYRPEAAEAKHYARWEEGGAFAPGNPVPADGAGNAPAYTIAIPPPNVTGSLHMGHALNNTLQDILIRYQRMRGRDTLWQVGTDHAGIATQMVVERQLAAAGEDRRALGRDEFIKRVWRWKEESGGTITGQLRRLGASCDWSRERFTMDEGLSRAVRQVFVQLHGEGLIYRDKRLVNWDPKLGTAISDLEVEQREEVGKLWYFRYPVEGAPDTFVTVATTRPETMLGDSAVAVHPDDPRHAALIGKRAILPLCDRPIPIVADAYADPEKGSGAVKITPAHDFNDFEVGRRHGLEMISVFDAEARINDAAPAPYRGLDRFAARDKVVADMEALGLLASVEDNPMTVPYGDRSGVVIEPFLTDQWFVDAAKLAGPAIAAVEDGRIQFVPRQWENTYFEWMRNIQPWCISRQLWWGHRIPAWYGPDGTPFVAEDEAAALAAANSHYGEAVTLTQDEDVLDTWFSSGLWPFSTLGWPDETPELAHHYPTDVLVTGFDIIFFWVARMIMLGLHFMGEVPFRTVYIHALVRDERGQKMSKSKGNVLDPLELVDRYGADALRFTLAAMAAQGRDIKLATGRIEGYRNFVTKLWNAARYAEMNGCASVSGFDAATAGETVNRWIAGELAATARTVEAELAAYRFNEAAGALYHFTWHTFCDWYLEFTKPILAGGSAAAQAETRAMTGWVIEQLLHLLHPFMPFVTEELWSELSPEAGRERLLMVSPWPAFDAALDDAPARAEMGWVVRLISAVRAVRSEMNVPPKAEIPLIIKDAPAEAGEALLRHRELITRLARLSSAETGEDVPAGSVQVVLDDSTLLLPLAGIIDVPAEKARLARERDKIEGEIGKLGKKLANKKFVDRAPAEVVEENRARLVEAEAARDRLNEALERLAAI